MRGYVYTLEVVFATAIVFASVIFIFNLLPPQQSSIQLIKNSAYDALQYMDYSGDLRPLVLAGDESQIESRLNSMLPVNLGFEAEVCSAYCSLTGVEFNRTVIAVDYYVAGFQNTYAGKKLRLWVWEKF